MTPTQIFKFLIPDVLKGIDDAIAMYRYGRGHKLEWAHSQVWRGVDVEQYLTRRGVRCYCRDYGEGKSTQGCRVPAAQAKWADWALRRAGVPVVGPALSNVKAGAPPKPWGDGVRGVGFAGLFVGRGKR